MMNSYHYCYYYCYGYDEYPSYCCCSILLNDFLSLDEHDLLHLETSLIFSVPQKDYSNGEKKKTTLTLCYLHPVSDLQTFNISHFCYGHYCHLGFFDHGFLQMWLKDLNMMFMQTYFTFHDDLFCSPAVYGLCTLLSLSVYFSLYHLNQ